MKTSNPNINNKLNLVIYQKYLELIYYTNDILRRYPESERFTFVKEIKTYLYNGLRLLMYAIKVYNKQEKLKYLNQFDININALKVHVRLSYKYKFITIQNYQTWSNLIANICNALRAWISSYLRRS